MTMDTQASGLDLTVQDVSVAFGGVQALRSVSLHAPAGRITAVIGPNGAGKTSLFNTISGFYKPSGGRIHLGGTDITSAPLHARAGMGLARTFQNVALFRGLSVLQNIKLGGHHAMRSGMLSSLLATPAARREEMALRSAVEDVIDFLELDNVRHKPVEMLSYGLQKRVELARGLAMSPKVLLLDEPVAGMNREETEDMARFILDVQEERGVTIVLVEHDMGMVMDISHHVAVLNFGELIAQGTPAEVARHPEVVKAYLGGEPAAANAC